MIKKKILRGIDDPNVKPRAVKAICKPRKIKQKDLLSAI